VNPTKTRDIYEENATAQYNQAGQADVQKKEKPDEKTLSASQEADIKRITEIREGLSEDHIAKDEILRIKANTALNSLHKAIIEDEDIEILRKKWLQQIKQLTNIYFEWISSFRLFKMRQMKSKLKAFERYADSLTPVRADANDFEEYLSPERSWKISSFGPQDVLVRSERFVYWSFAQIWHNMSKWPNQRILDKEDIVSRAQLIMNDVAVVLARTPRDSSYMVKYLINMFDFETGKQILALYLAIVFDTPEQAQDMLGNVGVAEAQRWDSDMFLHYSDSAFRANSREEYLQQEQLEKAKTAVFIGKMKDILEKTGIEPPLSLEIRVRDRAKRA